MPRHTTRLAVLAGHFLGSGSDAAAASDGEGAFISPQFAAQPTTNRRPPCIAVAGGSVADITATPFTGAGLRAGGSVPGGVSLAPGGVGRNVATAAARLLAIPGSSSSSAAPVALISAVGDDALGSALLGSLAGAGLDPAACFIPVVPGCATPAVVTVLDERGEVAASVAAFEGTGGRGGPSSSSPGGGGALGAALGTPSAAAAALGAAGVDDNHTTLLALDANLPPPALSALSAGLSRCRRPPDLFEPVSVAKAGRAIEAGVVVGLATPNAAELGAMATAARRRRGAPGSRDDWRTQPGPRSPPPPTCPPAVLASVAALADDARAVLGGRRWARGLVVTLGADGVVFLTGEPRPSRLPFGPDAPPPPPSPLGPLLACHVPASPGVTVVSAVGAGDALAGGLLVGGVEGLSVEEALGLGAAAAGQVVGVHDAAPALDGERARREGRALAGRAVWWVVGE